MNCKAVSDFGFSENSELAGLYDLELVPRNQPNGSTTGYVLPC